MNAAECSATYSATNARATSPYRPHNPGHNYYEAGAYLITLVIARRERLNDDAEAPDVALTALGRIVEEEWAKTAAIQVVEMNFCLSVISVPMKKATTEPYSSYLLANGRLAGEILHTNSKQLYLCCN